MQKPVFKNKCNNKSHLTDFSANKKLLYQPAILTSDEIKMRYRSLETHLLRINNYDPIFLNKG
jgi:hypothetical protein